MNNTDIIGNSRVCFEQFEFNGFSIVSHSLLYISPGGGHDFVLVGKYPIREDYSIDKNDIDTEAPF